MTKDEKISKLAEQVDKTEQLFTDYKKIDRNNLDKNDILTILRKQNEVWRSHPPVYWTDSNIEAPSFVPELFPEFIRDQVAHPFFKRQNFINQLSTTHLRRNLGASHTRLAHSHGTTTIAKAFIKSLEESGEEITDIEKQAVYTYAYIHDGFHGPFGHSLSHMKSYFGNISFNNKKLDKNLLYHQLKNDDILSSIFGDRFSESEEEEIKNLLEFFVDRQNHSLRKKYSDKYYLSEIMDSTIDADRLDYLFRDSHNLKYGLPTDETNLRKLIGTVQTKSVETDDGLELRRLCWPGSKKRQIEDLLKERRVLYTDVYESDSKIAVDEMVTHGLYHFLQYYDIDGARGGVDAEIMDEIALLTDTDLLNFFMDVGEPFFSRELIKDVYRGSFFTPIHDFEIEYPSENGSPNEPNRLEAANEEIKNIIDPNSPVDETTAREVRKVIKKTGGGLVFKELLFILVWEMLDRYHEQTKLESLFWEELMDDSHLRDIYTQSLLERYGMTDELSEYTDLVPEHYDSIYNIPSIFISIPTYVTRKRAENEIWEKEDSDTSIEWYDPPENEELDLPLRKQFQSKRVIICGPEPFVENDIDDKIEEKFKTFVKDVDNWLTPEIFR